MKNYDPQIHTHLVAKGETVAACGLNTETIPSGNRTGVLSDVSCPRCHDASKKKPRKMPDLKPLNIRSPNATDLLFRLQGPVEQDGTAVRGIGHNELYDALAVSADHALLLRAIVVGSVELVAGSVSGIGRDRWWLVFPHLKDIDGRPILIQLTTLPDGSPLLNEDARLNLIASIERHKERTKAWSKKR